MLWIGGPWGFKAQELVGQTVSIGVLKCCFTSLDWNVSMIDYKYICNIIYIYKDISYLFYNEYITIS